MFHSCSIHLTSFHIFHYTYFPFQKGRKRRQSLKIYKQKNAIILTGKAWQVRHMLKNYQKDYKFVKDWIEADTLQRKKEDKK